MKIVGTVMMGISIFLFGLLNYEKLKRRVDSIKWFLNFLSSYKFELKWSKKSIPELLKRYDKEKSNEYIKETLLNLSTHNLLEAFIDNNTRFKDLKLNDDEINALRYFFSESGKNNLETEVSLCEKTISYFESRAKDADYELKKTGPLSVKLGVICGAWILILLV